MSGIKLYGWLDLSGTQKPSYALVLRQAAGGDVSGMKLTLELI